MPRDITILMARWPGKRPPVMLPFQLRAQTTLPLSDEEWPTALDAPEGMGLLTVRWWDEIGVPANGLMRDAL